MKPIRLRWLLIRGNSCLLELLKTLLQIMEHLEAEHGKFLHGKQELLSIHFQQFTVADRGRGAEAAMVRINQRPCPEAAARTQRFDALTSPAELNGSSHDPKQAITRFAGSKNHIPGLDLSWFPVACQSRDRAELGTGVHDVDEK